MQSVHGPSVYSTIWSAHYKPLHSAMTFVRGGATSDETSWTSQVTDRGMTKEAEPPKIGGGDDVPPRPP